VLALDLRTGGFAGIAAASKRARRNRTVQSLGRPPAAGRALPRATLDGSNGVLTSMERGDPLSPGRHGADKQWECREGNSGVNGKERSRPERCARKGPREAAPGSSGGRKGACLSSGPHALD
jgi:hypothetical protein